MGNFADESWSPELHRAVKTLTIWKVILSQYKTRLWFEKQIKNCNAHDNMIFKNQIKNKISELTYTSTKELRLHGIGQDTGNGGARWTLISVPMMHIVDKEAPGCTIQMPNNEKKWEIKIVGFVDDNKHYVNNSSRKTKDTLEQAM